jgi:hypothetical protein
MEEDFSPFVRNLRDFMATQAFHGASDHELALAIWVLLPQDLPKTPAKVRPNLLKRPPARVKMEDN